MFGHPYFGATYYAPTFFGPSRGVRSGVASAIGTSAVVGVGRGFNTTIGTTDGTSIVFGYGQAIAQSVGTASGTSTVLAVGIGATIVSAIGTASGTSTVLGVGEEAKPPVVVQPSGGTGAGGPFLVPFPDHLRKKKRYVYISIRTDKVKLWTSEYLLDVENPHYNVEITNLRRVGPESILITLDSITKPPVIIHPSIAGVNRIEPNKEITVENIELSNSKPKVSIVNEEINENKPRISVGIIGSIN